jgi:hypothetical protein
MNDESRERPDIASFIMTRIALPRERLVKAISTPAMRHCHLLGNSKFPIDPASRDGERVIAYFSNAIQDTLKRYPDLGVVETSLSIKEHGDANFVVSFISLCS